MTEQMDSDQDKVNDAGYGGHITDYERGYIEGAAMAAWRIAIRCGVKEYTHCKRYDPATVSNGQVHSYVFDMEDGGRHHNLSDYDDHHDIVGRFIGEAVERIVKA